MNIFDSKVLTILLIRPGASDLDDQGRITGTLDVPLSKTGERQVRDIANDLEDVEPTIIYSGPGLASQQTSAALSHDGEIKVRVEEGLRNLDYGLWHGKRIDEIKETQPKLFRQWQEHPQSVCPPDGETVEQVKERVLKFLKKLGRKHKSGTIAIVAPEPVACIIQSQIEEKELGENWNMHGNCGRWQSVRFRMETSV